MPAPPEPSNGVRPEYKPPKEPVSRHNLPVKEPDEQPSRFPRLRGIAIFGGGLLLLTASLGTGVLAAKATCMVPVMLLYGGWTMVVGEPIGKDGKPAGWAQVGAWLCGVLGILAAVLVAALMS